jgi:hypothetical protein
LLFTRDGLSDQPKGRGSNATTYPLGRSLKELFNIYSKRLSKLLHRLKRWCALATLQIRDEFSGHIHRFGQLLLCNISVSANFSQPFTEAGSQWVHEISLQKAQCTEYPTLNFSNIDSLFKKLERLIAKTRTRYLNLWYNSAQFLPAFGTELLTSYQEVAHDGTDPRLERITAKDDRYKRP